MSVVINVKSDMESVMSWVARQYPRAFEIASQRTLLQVARTIRAAEVSEMQRVFNNPTRFTLGAFRVALNKKQMTAVVEIKDGYWERADNYLQAQIEGSPGRVQKGMEKALAGRGILPAGWVTVPGECAKLDRAGNHSVGEIRQILSWFDVAERVAGSTQNMGEAGRAKKRKGTKRKRGFEYFAVEPGQTRRGGGRQALHPGIYRRTFFGFGLRTLDPILIFVRKASYKPRFDFYGVANRVISSDLQTTMRLNLEAEVSKARIAQSNL